MDKLMIKNALILTIITLVSGLALGFTYELTKEPIARAKQEAKEAAYLDVFEDANSFVVSDEDLEAANNYLMDEGYTSNTLNEIMEAYHDQEQLGYVMTVTSSDGYGGDITFTCGITLDGNINGISILTISETAGLGMKATEDAFKNQFQDVASAMFEVVKVEPSSDNQIQAISGATITSKAITGGMNACVAYYQEMIGGDSNE